MKLENLSGAKIGLLQFPGSNCDMDCIETFKRHFGIDLIKVWHTEEKLPELQGLIIPGGFSYGDYLRGGSLASHSQIMSDVKRFAGEGGAIIGICNGFQILTESHLLPGILLRNDKQKFVCEFSDLTLQKGSSAYHKTIEAKKLAIPIAHGEGRYYVGKKELEKLIENNQIVFKYSNNPNGSVEDIAGICSENGKILGMMPHPERAVDSLFGSEDGLLVWKAFLSSFL